MSAAEAKKQQQKKDQRNPLIFRAGMVGLLLGMFGWLARGSLLEASVFLAIGAAYSILVWRVAMQSGRAFSVMLWSLILNFWTLISIDNLRLLAVPAAGPWFVGILLGGMAGSYVWLGPRAGAEFAPKSSPSGLVRCRLGPVPVSAGTAGQERAGASGHTRGVRRFVDPGRRTGPAGPPLYVGVRRHGGHPDRRTVLVREPGWRPAPAVQCAAQAAPPQETKQKAPPTFQLAGIAQQASGNGPARPVTSALPRTPRSAPR